MNFWNRLPKGFVGLAPMDGVTDSIYRYIIAEYGQPDVIITEFTAVEGLARNAVKLLKQFEYNEIERPIVAQVFGIDPESFYISAVIIAELGFDGMDINMGCPAKNVSGRGAGAGLIRNPELAAEIIAACKAGLNDYEKGIVSLKDLKMKQKMRNEIERHLENHPTPQKRYIPLSVKTRIGYDDIIVEKWVEHLLQQEPVVISLHGRTLKQMYTGNADWEAIGRAVKIAQGSGIKIVGNGDIHGIADAQEKIKKYGVDGVLIGRATFGNPWIFQNHEASLEERINLAIHHCHIFEEQVGVNYFFVMRKFLGWYIKGHPTAKDIRRQLMQANNTQEVQEILKVKS